MYLAWDGDHAVTDVLEPVYWQRGVLVLGMETVY